MITIGIISFNRLKYIKALIKSLSILDKSKIHIVVVDNGSWETGLIEFLEENKKLGNIQNLILRPRIKRNWINDEYIAKNIIIESTNTDMLLFLQDDLQFIGNQNYLDLVLKDFEKMNTLCLEMNGVRRSTNNSKFLKNNFFITTNNLKYWISDRQHFQTMGLYKKETFELFGKYPTSWPKNKDFWGRSEDYYDDLIKSKYTGIINTTCHVPLFIPVWNDYRGGYAFFRNDLRYAEYKSPTDSSDLYYEHIEYNDVISMQKNNKSISFIDIAKPIGWNISKSNDGDQLKYSQNNIVLNESGSMVE